MFWKCLLVCTAILIVTVYVGLNKHELFHFRHYLLLNLVGRSVKVPIEAYGTRDRDHWSQFRAHIDQRSILSTAGQRLPNIVLIIADDLGMNDIVGYVPTPHIDSIGARGAIFKTAYAGHPTCAPSRASLFTGRYAPSFGFEYMPLARPFARLISYNFSAVAYPSRVAPVSRTRGNPPLGAQAVPLEREMLAEALQKRGYDCFHLGKWHLGQGAAFTPRRRGYNASLGFLGGGSLYAARGDPAVVEAAPAGSVFDEVVARLLQYGVSFNDGPRFTPDRYMTDYLSEQTARLVQVLHGPGEAQRPFFISLAYNAVHDPMQALRSDYFSPAVQRIPLDDGTTGTCEENACEDRQLIHDAGRNLARVHGAMVLALDRGVGTVLSALERTGTVNNTLVVFTSDNGGAANNGVAGVNFPFRGFKCTFFEGGLRVPLALQWPVVVAAGQSVTTPVRHVDIFPTLLEAAEGEPVRTELGPSLVALLAPTGQQEQAEVDPCYSQNSDTHVSHFWRSGHYRVLLRGRFKLQISAQPDRVWLHDLALDPRERSNLADIPTACLHTLSLLEAAHRDRARHGSVNSAAEAAVVALGGDSAVGTQYRLLLRQEGAPGWSAAVTDAITALAVGMLAELWRESDRNTPDRGSGPGSGSGQGNGPRDGSSTGAATTCVCDPGTPECCRPPAPLWASAVEAAIPIDRLSNTACLTGDEHVYWHL